VSWRELRLQTIGRSVNQRRAGGGDVRMAGRGTVDLRTEPNIASSPDCNAGRGPVPPRFPGDGAQPVLRKTALQRCPYLSRIGAIKQTLIRSATCIKLGAALATLHGSALWSWTRPLLPQVVCSSSNAGLEVLWAAAASPKSAVHSSGSSGGNGAECTGAHPAGVAAGARSCA
jgi:hypothetical protein